MADIGTVIFKILNLLKAILITLILAIIGGIKALIPQSFFTRKNVSGKKVLITGAGSGLGRLMSLRFAKLGSRLILWDIDEKGVEATAKQCKEFEVPVSTYQVDLSSHEDTVRVSQQTKIEHGDIDILINNAGIVIGKPILETTDQQTEKVMNVNAVSHFWTIRQFLPSMLQRNDGHIVSIASLAGMFGAAQLIDYCSSKFAAVGLMESLHFELVQKNKTGVKTTTICPFYINTGMFAGVDSGLIPMLEPEWVADRIMDAILTDQPILFLPKSLYMLYFMKGFIPVRAGLYLMDQLQVLDSMQHFKGRN